MATLKKRVDFFETEEGIEIEAMLKQMAGDIKYSTLDSYSAKTELYPDNQITFVKKHMEYLRNHPSLNAHQYLANLRLITKVR